MVQRRSRGGTIRALLLLTAMGAMAFGAVDYSVREQRRGSYTEKIEEARSLMEEEKAWIRLNQGDAGEIYLNFQNPDDGEGAVNPYFACQAAMGLLTGEVSKQELAAVASYLTWHGKQLTAFGGEVSDYRYSDGELKPTGEYDSVDSYVAVYLTLLSRYQEKGGELASVGGCHEAVTVCMETLKSLTEDGLTRVAPGNDVFYLMDNAEVYEAYKKAAALMASGDPFLESWEEKESLERFCACAGEACRAAVCDRLWNDGESRYEIGVDGKGNPMNYSGWEVFYPDAVAEVYPAAFGLFPPEEEKAEELYRKFCSVYDWEHLFIIKEKFDWPILAYTAVLMGDIERAETYLHKYRLKYSANRAYPLHTADSAWAARACDELIAYYEKQKDTGLLEEMLERLKGSWPW